MEERASSKIIIIMKMRMTYLPTGLLTILVKSNCLGHRDPRSITDRSHQQIAGIILASS